MRSPACLPLRPATTHRSTVSADVLDTTWLASLAVVRRRVLTLLGSGVCLLAVGGDLLASAHVRAGAAMPAWPLCLVGAFVGSVGLVALGAMLRAARDLG